MFKFKSKVIDAPMVQPGTEPHVESMYAFFKRSRLVNVVGHCGASMFVYSMTLRYVDPLAGVSYLIIHQLLMALVAFTFYSEWTNARLDKNGLPRFVLHSNFLAKTFLPCLLLMQPNVGADSYPFCLAVMVVVFGCAAGTMVTLGPLKRLARQDLICMVLPATLAIFYYGHVFLGIGTLFFLAVVALAGLNEMYVTYTELIGLRVNSARDAEILDASNQQLVTAVRSLELEAKRRRAIESEREKLQDDLIKASREAGKSEIATGVLHNIGNVMNSVNVSSSIMQSHLKDGLKGQLDSAIGLLEEHSGDLGGFFKNDTRGEHFLPFMKEMNNQVLSVLDEIQDLRKCIDHVNGVVAAQQSYATSTGFVSRVILVDVVDEALKIIGENFRRNGINVVREYATSRHVTTDKQKLIQVLVNIFNNAKHAIIDHEGCEKTVRVVVDVEPDNRVRVSVSDNGVGISRNNLSKIFQHGFSTRKGRGGHGFGLHHSSLLMEEMGGEFLAESDGVGLGATFNIWIPFEIPELSKTNSVGASI